MARHLVLLPGIHGKGQLFEDFIAALPNTLVTAVVAYPATRFLSYGELRPYVGAPVPKAEPFVLLAGIVELRPAFSAIAGCSSSG